MTYRVDTIACVAFDHGEVDCPPEGEMGGCGECRWSRAWDSTKDEEMAKKRTNASATRGKPVTAEATARPEATGNQRCFVCGRFAHDGSIAELCRQHGNEYRASAEYRRGHLVDFVSRSRAEAANGGK